MRQKSEPKYNHWQEHISPDLDEECVIKICPICRKPACLDFWKDVDHEGYKVAVFRHSHFLKDSFEQKRNYNHVFKDCRIKLKVGELVETTRMKPAKIPSFIAEQFRDL
jgi:hypothetical protein